MPQFKTLLGLEISQTKIAKLLMLLTMPSDDPSTYPLTSQHVKYATPAHTFNHGRLP